MEILSNAESIQLMQNGLTAVVVAEGLRSLSDAAGNVLISRGPRFKAASAALGRLRPVPDRLGVVDDAAETHAVILARNCRTEEMELTQRWSFTSEGHLKAELEFIVPPACAGLEYLGVELDYPGKTPAFEMTVDRGAVEMFLQSDGGSAAVLLPDAPVAAGIYRMNIVFIAKI